MPILPIDFRRFGNDWFEEDICDISAISLLSMTIIPGFYEKITFDMSKTNLGLLVKDISLEQSLMLTYLHIQSAVLIDLIRELE